MFAYIIKKNGYDLCRATGKKQAVERITKHLDWTGSTGDRYWHTKSGHITCTVKDKGIEIVFSVERLDKRD